LISHQTAVT